VRNLALRILDFCSTGIHFVLLNRVPSFEATKYLISNKEYKEFVDAGGYQEKGLWTTEGWQWVQYRSVKHPQFWVCHRGCKSNCGADLASHSHCNLPQPNGNQPFLYKYRAMYDVIDMPWDWPVEVNYHEAKAFCAWKGPDFRLPTEAEHHVISGEKPANTDYESDHICCSDYKANLNMTYGSPTPVNFYPPNSLGFYDSYGNVWKWSEDHFNGLCNFKTIYLYDDFSSPCFDGRHNVIQGGSWVSTGDCASRFARFAFRRHFIQHAGFRIVRSNDYSSVRLCDCTVFIEGAGVVGMGLRQYEMQYGIGAV
jgi:formylglycine-generating enzyme required for sulfatase activity